MATSTHPPRLSPNPPPQHPGGVGHVLLVIAGAVLGLVGLALAGLATAAAWGLVAQRDGRFLTTPTERYTVGSYALTTTELKVLVDPALPSGSRAVRLMVRATAADPARPVFVGIGPREQVEQYLADVPHTELTSVAFRPFRPTYRDQPGARTPTPPGQQTFWAASQTGTGSQQLETPLASGTWMVVVMNADASRPVAVDLAAGARTTLLRPLALGSGVSALVLLVAGVGLLVAGSSRLAGSAGHTDGGTPAAGHLAVPGSAVSAYHSPARLTGELEPVSRWLWLVKWLLIIPHGLILLVLWPVTFLVTLVAAVAILVTGRYPRPLFDFTVGVLRWSWRVGFYAYSALGTDRYPPFTLARTDYPADFDVEYPEHLSRGLVLVKSWLLAIPHLVIVALLTTPWYWAADQTANGRDQQTGGISLLGLLTLVAGLALLFAGRYPRPLFDLVLGINRWVYRVMTYVALLRDEYPPFRLDQGAREPDELPPGGRDEQRVATDPTDPA